MRGGAEASVRRGTSGTLRRPEGTDVSCPVVTGVSCFQCLVPLTRTATANRQWTRRTPEVSAVFQSHHFIVQQEHSLLYRKLLRSCSSFSLLSSSLTPKERSLKVQCVIFDFWIYKSLIYCP